MLRDNLVELIEPMLNSAGADPLALYIHTPVHASDDSLPCLKNPRREGAEFSLMENVTSPFQAEPAHFSRGGSVSRLSRQSGLAFALSWRISRRRRSASSKTLDRSSDGATAAYSSAMVSASHARVKR